MKNLKNMLFAAAIGAVAIALPATASAADTACTIKDDKTVTVSADCTLTVDASTDANVNTITVNADRKLTIAGTGKLDATFVGTGEIDAGAGVQLSGTFTNQNITGGATILLDSSESFKTKKGTTLKFEVADGSTRLAIYNDSYTGKNYVTYTCDKKLTDDAITDAKKDVYVNSASGDYTFKIPAALGNYAYIVSSKKGEDILGTVSDDKKSVVFDKKTDSADIVITVNTGTGEAADNNGINIHIIKPESADLEENDAVVSAIVDDYVAAMNKDAKNPSFTTKVSGGKVGEIVGKNIVTEAKNSDAADNDIKAWAAANGYTVLQYFEGTAKVGNVEITVLPKATTVNGTAKEDIVLPAAPEGKKVELVVLNLHGDTPEVVDNTVTLNANNKKKFTFETTKFSPMALAYHIVDATPATPEQGKSTETNTGDATKEANPKTSDNVMTSVVSLLVSAFGLTAAGLKLKNN